MAKGLNRVMLIGRLGADPELRYTQDEVPVVNFRLATDTPIKRGDQWESETEWHKIVAWRRLAEICSEYLKKGRQVYVEGRIRTRSWEDQDGNKRWTTEIVAQDIVLLGNGNGGNGGGNDEVPPPPEGDDVPF